LTGAWLNDNNGNGIYKIMATLLPALLYAAAAIFLIGMGWRMWRWLRTPSPLIIVLTPGPKTSWGVARRLMEEMFGFHSLFKADWAFWIPAWLFHLSLVLLLGGHFGGLVAPKFAQAALGLTEIQFERLAQVAGSVVGILALATVLGLLLRRLAAERPRRISTFSDFFALALLLLIIISGNQMRFMGGLDLMQARRFVAGWLAFAPVAPPAGPVFAAHILLICALLVYIPFSKLVHLGGATLFSPTLNQQNNPRTHRHANSWDALPASNPRQSP
jgi:nitrate reductase gamma subunit